MSSFTRIILSTSLLALSFAAALQLRRDAGVGRRALIFVYEDTQLLGNDCDQLLQRDAFKARIATRQSKNSEQALYSLLSGNYGSRQIEVDEEDPESARKKRLSNFFTFSSLIDQGRSAKAYNSPIKCSDLDNGLCDSKRPKRLRTDINLQLIFSSKENLCLDLKEAREFNAQSGGLSLFLSLSNANLEPYPLVLSREQFEGQLLALGEDVRSSKSPELINTEDVMAHVVVYLAPYKQVPASKRIHPSFFRSEILRRRNFD